VELATFGMVCYFADLFGYKNYPGVQVTVDKDQQIALEIRVIIQYGMNIPTVARQIQDVIQDAVESALDINLREINVNIHAIERRAA
jgi:uncharacterized alkaline shock family protein YloU